MRRQAVTAGHFYPNDAASLTKFIETNRFDGEPVRAKLLVVPHAGYRFSGALMVKTLSKARIPDTVLIIGPNHTGFGAEAALYDKGVWATPLGDVEVDGALAAELLSSGLFEADYTAHAREYSAEVILPVIKYLNPGAKFVPIALMGMDYKKTEKISSAIAKVAGRRDILIVVSADLSHDESLENAEKKDALVINCMLSLDGKSLYDTVSENGVATCSLYAMVVGINTAKANGADKGELVGYAHSGLVTKTTDNVVGYAGIIIS